MSRSFKEIKAARNDLENGIEAVADQVETTVANLLASANEQLEKLTEIQQFLASKLEEIETAHEKLDALDEITERIEGVTAQFDSHRETVIEQLEQFVDIADSVSDSTTKLAGSLIEDQLDKMDQFTADIVTTVTDETEDFVSELEEKRDQASESLRDQFCDVVPNGVLKQTEKLAKTLEQLDESGLREITRVSDSVGEISDQLKELEALIEEIRPVLDLVRQLL